jgi:hypothetical protein
MPKVALPDTFSDFEGLINTASRYTAGHAPIVPPIGELRVLLGRMRAIETERKRLQAARQQATRELWAAREEGKRIASRLRSYFKSVHGADSPHLIEFGVRPRRSARGGEAPAPVVAGTAPVAPPSAPPVPAVAAEIADAAAQAAAGAAAACVAETRGALAAPRDSVAAAGAPAPDSGRAPGAPCESVAASGRAATAPREDETAARRAPAAPQGAGADSAGAPGALPRAAMESGAAVAAGSAATAGSRGGAGESRGAAPDRWRAVPRHGEPPSRPPAGSAATLATHGRPAAGVSGAG